MLPESMFMITVWSHLIKNKSIYMQRQQNVINVAKLTCSRTWVQILAITGNACRHKAEHFKQAFISFADVDRVITGNVCLKSPGSNINPFLSGLLFSCKSSNDP
jgi:hypothetical protein